MPLPGSSGGRDGGRPQQTRGNQDFHRTTTQ